MIVCAKNIFMCVLDLMQTSDNTLIDKIKNKLHHVLH